MLIKTIIFKIILSWHEIFSFTFDLKFNYLMFCYFYMFYIVFTFYLCAFLKERQADIWKPHFKFKYDKCTGFYTTDLQSTFIQWNVSIVKIYVVKYAWHICQISWTESFAVENLVYTFRNTSFALTVMSVKLLAFVTNFSNSLYFCLLLFNHLFCLCFLF